MKLRYDFTVMDMGGEFAAVPVGEDKDKFHGMLKLNEVSAIILSKLKEEVKIIDIHNALKEKYNESTDEEIAEKLVPFLNYLFRSGLLLIKEDERKFFLLRKRT